MPDEDGKPLVNLNDLKIPDLSPGNLTNNISITQIKQKISHSFDGINTFNMDSNPVYKWQNSAGVIQYTSDKPAKGIEYVELSAQSDKINTTNHPTATTLQPSPNLQRVDNISASN